MENFLTKHRGNFGVEEEMSLWDDNTTSCLDLHDLWPSGSTYMNFRTFSGNSSSFNLSISITDELSLLFANQTKDKLAIHVLTGKYEDGGHTHHQIFRFKRCGLLSDWTFGCSCEHPMCLVYVTIAIHDQSIMSNINNLKICEIHLSST